MAGIVKSTKKRIVVNKKIREIQTPSSVLDTDLYYADLVALGVTNSNTTITTELNRLPLLVKNEAVLALVANTRRAGNLLALNGDTKSVELLKFSRASSATYNHPTGVILYGPDLARQQYDPESGALKGFLFEPAGTNLFTDSGILDGLLSFTTRSSSGLTPVDTDFVMGDLLTKGMKFENIVTGDTFAYKSFVNSEVGKTYTFSFFVKMSDSSLPTKDDLSLVVNGSRYNIDTSITKITSYGKGIYRIEIFIKSLAANFIAGVTKYKSQSTKTFIVTGYQLEAGDFATSYIPTTTGTATRLADKLTDVRPLSVFTFNSWFIESDLYTGWFGNGVNKLNFLGRNLVCDSLLKRWKTYSKGSITVNSGSTTQSLRFDVDIDNSINQGITNGSTDAKMIIQEGQTYTISYLIRGNISGLNYSYIMRPVGENSSIISMSLPGLSDTNFTLFSKTFVAPFSSDNASLMLSIIASQVSAGKWFEVKEIKLEKGSVATPWTISPEDIVKISNTGNVEVSSDVPINIRSLSLVARELKQSEV